MIHATNCLKSVTPIDGLTATTNSKRASCETGTKSFAESKLGWFSTIGSRYMVGPVVTRTVALSGAAPFTARMPIRPSPPVRFSTMKLRSSSGPKILRQLAAQHVAAAAGRERER